MPYLEGVTRLLKVTGKDISCECVIYDILCKVMCVYFCVYCVWV